MYVGNGAKVGSDESVIVLSEAKVGVGLFAGRLDNLASVVASTAINANLASTVASMFISSLPSFEGIGSLICPVALPTALPQAKIEVIAAPKIKNRTRVSFFIMILKVL